MTYIDAAELPESPDGWFRKGDRYRLGQYGIRERDGTYDTYAIIGGTGYRTGAGLDSFAKSVSHIKGLVPPEDVTERHYTDTRGIGSAEDMAGTGSFAKFEDRTYGDEVYGGYNSKGHRDEDFNLALNLVHGGSAAKKEARQDRINRLIAAGECEKAASAVLFVNHGGPLPDFMYDTEYGRGAMESVERQLMEPYDNPPMGTKRGTRSAEMLPMRAVMSFISSAIHAAATGERRDISFYELLPPTQKHTLHNMFNMLDALDEGEAEKRSKGKEYIAEMYDDNGELVNVRVNDAEISKRIQQAFPIGTEEPYSIPIDLSPFSFMNGREKYEQRTALNGLVTDTSGQPRNFTDYRLRFGPKLTASPAAQNAAYHSLDTSRPLRFGSDNEYGWGKNVEDYENNLDRYKSLLAKRGIFEQYTRKYSTDPNISAEALDRLNGDREKLAEEHEVVSAAAEDAVKELRALQSERDELKAKGKEEKLSDDETKRLNQLQSEGVGNAYNKVRLFNSRAYRLKRELNALDREIGQYGKRAEFGANSLDQINREIESLKSTDEVRAYDEDPNARRPGAPPERKNVSFDDIYLTALTKMASERMGRDGWLGERNPYLKDVSDKVASTGRLDPDDLSAYEAFMLNQVYGPELLKGPGLRYIKDALYNESKYSEIPQRYWGYLAETTGGDPEEEETKKLVQGYVNSYNDIGMLKSYDGIDKDMIEDAERMEEYYARELGKRNIDVYVRDAKGNIAQENGKDRYLSPKVVKEEFWDMFDTAAKNRNKLRNQMIEDDLRHYLGLSDIGRISETQDKNKLYRAVKRAALVSYTKFGGSSDFLNPDEPASRVPIAVTDLAAEIDPKTGKRQTIDVLYNQEEDRSSEDEFIRNIEGAFDNRRRRNAAPQARLTVEEKDNLMGKGRRGKSGAAANDSGVRYGTEDELNRDLVDMKVGASEETETPGEAEDDSSGEKPEGEPEKEEAKNDDAEHKDMDENSGKDEAVVKSDDFVKAAKSANDSRRSMSFREVMGEAASKREKEQGLPTWTDTAGMDMRECDVWKDLWRTVYMEGGDGTPTKVKMKVFRDE